MSRIQDLKDRQDQFDRAFARLTHFTANRSQLIELISVVACPAAPEGPADWAEAGVPARADRQQIRVLERILGELPAGSNDYDNLAQALEWLKAPVAGWVPQLKRQAQLTDVLDQLELTVGKALTRLNSGKPFTQNQAARLKAKVDALIAKALIITDPDTAKNPVVGFATRKQLDWLKVNKEDFRQISHIGAYVLLTQTITKNGIVEKRPEFKAPKVAPVSDDYSWLEAMMSNPDYFAEDSVEAEVPFEELIAPVPYNIAFEKALADVDLDADVLRFPVLVDFGVEGNTRYVEMANPNK